MMPNGEYQIIGPDRSQIFDAGVNFLLLRHQCENPYCVHAQVSGRRIVVVLAFVCDERCVPAHAREFVAQRHHLRRNTLICVATGRKTSGRVADVQTLRRETTSTFGCRERDRTLVLLGYARTSNVVLEQLKRFSHM